MESSSDAPPSQTSESVPTTAVDENTFESLGITNIIVSGVYALIMVFLCGGNLLVENDDIDFDV